MSRSQRRKFNLASADGVMVAYLTREQTDSNFQNCERAMEAYDRRHHQRIFEHGDVMTLMGSDGRIAAARNTLTAGFLHHPKRPPWMLMLDDDMVFPATLADDLVAAADAQERPIVGGLCFIGRFGEVRPTINVMVHHDPPTYEPVWNYPENALVGCDYTGAAALLIHRRVVEDLAHRYRESPQTWFAEATIKDREYGEDAVFCMRARAAGYPIFVHTGIKLGHMKKFPLDEDSYRQYRRGITDEGEENYLLRQKSRLFVAIAPSPVVRVEEVA